MKRHVYGDEDFDTTLNECEAPPMRVWCLFLRVFEIESTYRSRVSTELCFRSSLSCEGDSDRGRE